MTKIKYLLILLTLVACTGMKQDYAEATPVSSTNVQFNDRLQTIYEATCRVSVQGGIGTGTIFHETNEHYFILTNAHVVGRSRNVSIEFTKAHYPSPKIAGRVLSRKLINGGSFDVAIVSVTKSSLNGVTLPVIPLAGEGDQPLDLKYLTCGCQAGEMPSVQQVISSRKSGKLIYYKPPARPGRSGSSLVDTEANKIHGLVAWTNGEEGLAMTADAIRGWIEEVSSGRTAKFDEPVAVRMEELDLPKGAIQIPLSRSDVDYEKSLQTQQNNPESPWHNSPSSPTEPFQDDPFGGINRPRDNSPWNGGGILPRPRLDNPDPIIPKPIIPKPQEPQPRTDEFENKALVELGNINGKLDAITEIVSSEQTENANDRRRFLDFLKRKDAPIADQDPLFDSPFGEAPKEAPPRLTPPRSLPPILTPPTEEIPSQKRKWFDGSFLNSFGTFGTAVGSTLGSVVVWVGIGVFIYFFVPPGYLGTLFWYAMGRLRIFTYNMIAGGTAFFKGKDVELPENNQAAESIEQFKEMIKTLTDEIKEIKDKQ